MRIALLDVNTLLALAWPNHQFHGRARSWFSASADAGWATCPLTQLGFIRLSSNPAFTPHCKTPSEAGSLLARVMAHKYHHFVADMPGTQEAPFVALTQKLHGYRQITDAYLLALADARGLCLLTFDRRLRHIAPHPDCVQLLHG